MAALLVVSSLAAGCNRRPKGVLSDSEMTDVLTDLILADAYEQSAASSQLPDSVRRNLSQSVLKAHGIDQATLDSTYSWYARNLDDYYKLYTKVDRRLTERRRKASGGLDQSNVENDIWSLPKHLLFSQLSPSDALVFEIPSESLQKGDRLEWQMHLSSPVETELLLGIDYEDGTSSIATRNYNSDRKLTLSLICDTARRARRIYGTISFDRNKMPVWVDSIYLSRNPFDSVSFMGFRAQKFYIGPAKKVDRNRSVSEKLDSINSAANKGRESATFKTMEEMRDERQPSKSQSSKGKQPLSNDGTLLRANSKSSTAGMHRTEKPAAQQSSAKSKSSKSGTSSKSSSSHKIQRKSPN